MSKETHQPFTLVGCSFQPAYPGNLHSIHQEMENRRTADLGWDSEAVGFQPVSLVLIRDPDNPHDSNAIQVHCPDLGRQSMIGHINRHLAAVIAPRMDAGQQYEAHVVSVNIRPDKPDQPGLTMAVTEVSD